MSSSPPVDWVRLAGPDALGRSLVVRPGAPVPRPWSGARRVRLDAPDAVTELALARTRRHRLVVEVDDDARLTGGRGDGPSSSVRLVDLTPGTVPSSADWMGPLVLGHAVDARDPDRPRVAAVDAARAAGARPATGAVPGDVVTDDGPVWCDGGPLTAFAADAVGGLGVVPAVHLAAGSLTPLRCSGPDADLAADQLAAVRHPGGPARIVAPAGSGKTRVLTERVRHLVRDLGVDPATICLVAFNVRARTEMAERTRDLPGLEVRTLNSLALAIASGSPPFAPPPEGAPVTIDERAVRDRLRRLVPKRRRVAMSDPFSSWIEALTACRLGLRDPAEVERAYGGEVDGLAGVLEAYRAGLAADGVVDFDEQIVRAVEILLTDGDRRRVARRACGVLLVDEFQDLTPAHLLLVRLLAGPRAEIFAVGDDDQTIYGYAGASPAWLIDFDLWFPGAVHHDLHVNYRCPPEVVSAAARLLGRNRRRLDKRISAAPGRSPAPPGASPPARPLVVASGDDPVGILVSHVDDLIAAGVGPDDVAVLARVNATLLAPYLALDAAGVPTDVPLGVGFLRRTGVEATRAWLHLATTDDGRFRARALQVAVRRPPRGLRPRIADWVGDNPSLAALGRLAERLREPRDGQRIRDFVHDVAVLRDAVAGGADTRTLLTLVRDRVGLGAALDSRLDASKRALHRSSHGDDLDALVRVADLEPDPARFGAWLRERLERPPVAGPRVTLATVHRVKGREWPHVVVFGADAGLFPHRLADDLEEERRVFHVAITRARRGVTVITGARPSPFVDELRTEPPSRPPAEVEVPEPRVDGPAPEPGGPEVDSRRDALREWRRTRAARDGVPAYVVFDDRTLEALARSRPCTDAELLAVRGIGKVKLERYGAGILAVLWPRGAPTGDP